MVKNIGKTDGHKQEDEYEYQCTVQVPMPVHIWGAYSGKYRVTQKNGNFWKNQQKLKKSKKKYLLAEIEPLQLAF